VTTNELETIENYLDEVPRATATPHDLPTLTIFTAAAGEPSFYARPRRDRPGPVNAADLRTALDHQAKIGQPQALEWIESLAPELDDLAQAAELVVHHYPLMILRTFTPHPPPAGFTVRIVPPDAPDLALVNLTIGLGFRQSGTATGDLGVPDRDAEAAKLTPVSDRLREELTAGRFVLAAADGKLGPVAGGSFSPRAAAAEITGVSTLPAFRRRGIGTAVTSSLVAEALRRRVTTCFLAAGSDAIARVYAHLGFARIDTACAAAPVGS
jgi:GNAT superfamily N-acetyltransferase